MGPKASTPADNTQNQEELKINHDVFKIAQLIKNKDDQSFIKTQVRLANKNEFDAWAKRLNGVPANDSLMLPTAHYYTNEGLCGNSGIAHITYDNFPYLLSDQIANRECLNKKLFEENELWYLVYTLLSAAVNYHQQGAKVGDIRPDNIFINEDGQVKVACVDSWPGQVTNYARAFYEKQKTYLSPQQIKDYQFGKMQQSVDKQLAETFSIGLTCLDAATLSNSKQLYSKNFKFDYGKFQEKIAEFKKYGYSQLLTLTVQNMCEVDTEFRSTARQIFHWLQPYEDAITNLEDFQVTGLPEKMGFAREKQFQSSALATLTPAQNSQFIGSTYIQAPIQQTIQNPVQHSIQTPIQQTIQTPSHSQIQQTVYGVPLGQNIQSYSQPPVQINHYTPPTVMFKPQSNVTPTVNFQVFSQPSSYQVPVTQVPSTNFSHQGTPSYYAVNSSIPSSAPNFGGEGAKFTLQQINQQLQQSRRMFPQ